MSDTEELAESLRTEIMRCRSRADLDHVKMALQTVEMLLQDDEAEHLTALLKSVEAEITNPTPPKPKVGRARVCVFSDEA
jgi:hypothetical protein